MKIFSAKQIKELDEATIQNEPISSTDLMERAGYALSEVIKSTQKNHFHSIAVFCGPGNNGGDGLVLARTLGLQHIDIQVFYAKSPDDSSDDFKFNFEALTKLDLPNINISKYIDSEPPKIHKESIIVDAIFGIGLKRDVDDEPWISMIKFINKHSNKTISIDIPSGMFPNKLSAGAVIEADYTYTLETAKLAFFLPENERFVGKWIIVSISLDESKKDDLETAYEFISASDIGHLLKTRLKFAHKGIFGHALIIAGSVGKMGAAILAAKAALRSGVGKLTMHVPNKGLNIIQTSVPEAMAINDDHSSSISSIGDINGFQAIGIGCGIGVSKNTTEALTELLNLKHPCVIDADALNILAKEKSLIKSIPRGSILTPHLGEFERLFGTHSDHFKRIETGLEKAKELQSIIVLKGANSAIFSPDGIVYFNSTGNPGMATAGSGDVLTGLITGLLAQGYSSLSAAKLGVYTHGLSGDIAAKKIGQESLIASDLIENLGLAFQTIHRSAENF